MLHVTPSNIAGTARRTIPSPLMLCDRLLTLAQDADRAGLAITAEHLLHLAHGVFDEPKRGSLDCASRSRPASRASASARQRRLREPAHRAQRIS
jgi:hypothetical protein